MNAKLYFPNNTIIITDFIIDSFSYTEVYYNELKPADNSCQIKIPFDVTIANNLKIYNNDDIKVEIKTDSGTNFLTGYVRKSSSFQKKQRNQPISIEIVNPSYLLKIKLTEPLNFINYTVSQIVNVLLSQVGFNSSGTTNISSVLLVFNANIGDTIYDILVKLLFEYGYVFDFNNNGNFVMYPLFNQPGTITQVFNGTNIRENITQKVNEEKYDDVQAEWHNTEFKQNVLIFRDTQGGDAAHQCQIKVQPNSFLFDKEYNYLDYDSELGDVKYVSSITDRIEMDLNLTKTLSNEGTRAKLKVYNPFEVVKFINRMEIWGDAYIDMKTNINKTGNSKRILEIKTTYLNDKDTVDALIKHIANYYRYADFTITLQSYVDYPLGSFVAVSEYGMGTLTGRIVSKKYKLRSTTEYAIDYTIEAISEFTPATEAQTESTLSGNSNNVSSPARDTVPPTPPVLVTCSANSNGTVRVEFSQSTDTESGVDYYRIYRRTTLIAPKVVFTVQHTGSGNLTFVDESTPNGFVYYYQVSAVDNVGNESTKSNEMSAGTAITDKPFSIASVSAYADNADFIRVVIVPYQPDSTDDDKYTAASFFVRISRNGGSSWSDLPEAQTTVFPYYYDRAIDGYPEKTDLANYRIRVYARNIYGNLSEVYKDTTLNTTGYLTWIPTKIPLIVSRASGRNLSITWDSQVIYGELRYRIQISKDSTAWFKPASDVNVYESIDNWKTGVQNEYIDYPIESYSQGVPLNGQNDTPYNPVDTLYYYRVKPINNTTGNVSIDWTSTSVVAKATSAMDIVTNAIDTARLENGAVKTDKIYLGAVTAEKIHVPYLNTISANISVIHDGQWDGNNYWALDDVYVYADGIPAIPYDPQYNTAPKTKIHNAGEFQIGDGVNHILKFIPGEGLTIKTTKVEITTIGTKVKGGLQVVDDNPAGAGYNLLEVDQNGNTVTIGDTAQNVNTTLYGTESIKDTTNSTSATTGALQVAGGVGIAKDVYIGGKIIAPNGLYGTPPAAAGGTLFASVSGAEAKIVTLTPGWYWVEVASGGGGGGISYNSNYSNGDGGDGGYVKKVIFIPFSINCIIVSSTGGKGGKRYTHGGSDYFGGGGGGASAFYIIELGIYIACSGGGGGNPYNSSFYGGDGGACFSLPGGEAGGKGDYPYMKGHPGGNNFLDSIFGGKNCEGYNSNSGGEGGTIGTIGSLIPGGGPRGGAGKLVSENILAGEDGGDGYVRVYKL